MSHSLAGRNLWCGLLVAGLLALAGCGGPKTGDVSGMVNYEGKPLPGGFVNFNILAPDGTVAESKSTTVEKNGRYKISRVPVGEAKITVQGPPGEITQPKIEGGMPFRAKPAVVIPDSYGLVEKSPLNYTVTAGEQTHDIDLK
jgi:hypothetical protein